jgi:hypothetical protein
MGMLTPWFLAAGVAAVGLPVWLHLLRQHKSQPQPFGSLMFFEQRLQSSIKHRRLRYLLLFALRTALLVLLALAFAQPFVRRPATALPASSEVTVFAIDNSLSMQAGGRIDEAKRMARSAINALPVGRRGQVIAFGSRVHGYSEVTSDHSALAAALQAIAAGDDHTSYAELSRSLRSIAQSLKVPLRVELYSDMQKTGFPGAFGDLRLGAGVTLEPQPVVKQSVANLALENVVAPARVYGGNKTRVLATVASFGAPKGTYKVTLLLNGHVVESKSVEVAEGGRAPVEFLSLDVPFGRNKGEVRLEAGDALPADNVFYFSVERQEARHALLVHESDASRDLLYFRTALESSGPSAFTVDAVTPDQTANLDPTRFAFIVLSDVASLPTAFESHLRSYVNGGGGVLVALGARSAARGSVPLVNAKIDGARYTAREDERFESAAWLDASHASVLKNDNWSGVKFYRVVRFAPEGARVVARFADQSPLLADWQLGGGHVLALASTLDNISNDFPIHATFVPFIEQSARYLGRLDAGGSSVTVGAFAELRAAAQKGESVQVIDPKGERVLSLSESATTENVQFTTAGFYSVERPNGRDQLVAVNADRRESDLEPAPGETLTLWAHTAGGNDSGSAGAGGGDSQSRVPLWWYAMLAALAVALAESWVGNRHLAVDKGAV